jgi:hypothetical protein
MIDAALLESVLAGVSPQLTYDDLARQLRASFPGVHITVCGEDDVPPRLPPAAENEYCYLYYVDANEHCLKLTTDAETATGLAVAMRSDDD